MGLKSWFADFRNGLKVIFGKPEPGEGDRKLAQLSNIIMGQISIYGKDTVRNQVIKSIDNDLRRDAKKGGLEAVEKRLQNALDTPEYMQMLHKLGVEEPHLRIMAMEAVKNAN